MKRLSREDGYEADWALRVVDVIATGGIMVLVVGMFLLILFTPGSFGATSPQDLEATTMSESFQGPERPTLETLGKESVNLNLGKKPAARMPSRVKGIPGFGDSRSENGIRADETVIHLLAPWQ